MGIEIWIDSLTDWRNSLPHWARNQQTNETILSWEIYSTILRINIVSTDESLEIIQFHKKAYDFTSSIGYSFHNIDDFLEIRLE